jgi:hypothetical protein
LTCDPDKGSGYVVSVVGVRQRRSFSMHRFVAAATAVLLVVTVALSDEFVGIITKFEDGKITFTKFKKGEKPEAETMKVSQKVKFMKAKFNPEEKKFEVNGELEGGKEAFVTRLKDAIKNKKGKFGGGVFAQIVTKGEGDKARVTEIRVLPAFKGKGKKKDGD